MDENTGVNTPVAEEKQEVQTEAVAKTEAEQKIETEDKTETAIPEEKTPWDEIIKDPDYNKAMDKKEDQIDPLFALSGLASRLVFLIHSRQNRGQIRLSGSCPLRTQGAARCE